MLLQILVFPVVIFPCMLLISDYLSSPFSSSVNADLQQNKPSKDGITTDPTVWPSFSEYILALGSLVLLFTFLSHETEKDKIL